MLWPRAFAGAVVFLSLALSAWSQGAGPEPWLIVFGDSLSDTGNVYAQSNGSSPSSRYWRGRFSNGPVYVDDLARDPQLHNITIVNYAFGGATSCPQGRESTCLQEQVDLFLGGHLPPAYINSSLVAPNITNTTGLINIGSNDFIISLVGSVGSSFGARNLTNSTEGPLAGLAEHVMQCLSVQAKRLLNSGMPQLVLFNLPPLSSTPLLHLVKIWAPATAEALQQQALLFNQLISNFTDSLRMQGYNVSLFDFNATVMNLTQPGLGFQHLGDDQCIGFSLAALLALRVANPTAENSTAENSTAANSTDPGPGLPTVPALVKAPVPLVVKWLDRVATDVCGSPDDYAFYDLVHPSARAHQIFGSSVAGFLAQL